MWLNKSSSSTSTSRRCAFRSSAFVAHCALRGSATGVRRVTGNWPCRSRKRLARLLLCAAAALYRSHITAALGRPGTIEALHTPHTSTRQRSVLHTEGTGSLSTLSPSAAGTLSAESPPLPTGPFRALSALMKLASIGGVHALFPATPAASASSATVYATALIQKGAVPKSTCSGFVTSKRRNAT